MFKKWFILPHLDHGLNSFKFICYYLFVFVMNGIHPSSSFLIHNTFKRHSKSSLDDGAYEIFFELASHKYK
jgi:hypothetical protein